MSKTVKVTKRFTFEASHNLINYKGKCANLHGHSYKLEVTFVRSFGLDNQGMVLDFNKVNEIVEPIINRYDHAYLNDFFSNPTAEVMANSIFDEIDHILEEERRLHSGLENVHVIEVKLWETEKCYVTVS